MPRFFVICFEPFSNLQWVCQCHNVESLVDIFGSQFSPLLKHHIRVSIICMIKVLALFSPVASQPKVGHQQGVPTSLEYNPVNLDRINYRRTNNHFPPKNMISGHEIVLEPVGIFFFQLTTLL